MSVSKVTRQRSIKDWLVPLEPGELSVFKCSPSYHYRMNAADKEKNLIRLNISSVAQLKELCRPVKTKPPITSTPKRRYNPRKKPQAAAAAGAKRSGARPVKTSQVKNMFQNTTSGGTTPAESVPLPKSVPIKKEKSVEELKNVSNQLEYQEVSCEDASLRRSPNMTTTNDDRAGAGMGVVQPTGLSETDVKATDIVSKLEVEKEEGFNVPTWEVCSDGRNYQPPDNTSDTEEVEPNYDLMLLELKEELFC
ncbi:uncharacterized protein LOC111071792 isoform X2 [Drosophila obscura]|uniref:uncharacterized protein LOC111071792 isoform X2 n=1 Tax=Drosophila obscura TaxID=7282 RepID=UPI001BB10E66|nr:uncharacterized protein LOC111071792 isoform X2 [Drosophila obscura]